MKHKHIKSVKEQIIQFIKEQIVIYEQHECNARYECQEARAQGAYDALEDVLEFIEEL